MHKYKHDDIQILQCLMEVTKNVNRSTYLTHNHYMLLHTFHTEKV